MSQVRPSPLAWLTLAFLLAFGCGTPRWAIVDGKKVDRPSFGYSDGKYYAFDHRRAFPNVFAPRARSVDDGRLVGRACGLDLDFDASWYGARLSLIGRLELSCESTTEYEGKNVRGFSLVARSG